MVKGQQVIPLQILKTGDASTLAVVAGVRAKLPEILKALPPGISIRPFNDASKFVRTSIEDGVQEMVTAAILAGLAVLIFGVWHTFGDPAEWGGLARSVHAPLYGHEAELTHPTNSGHPTCVSGAN
jgi:hypothetical protein